VSDGKSNSRPGWTQQEDVCILWSDDDCFFAYSRGEPLFCKRWSPGKSRMAPEDTTYYHRSQSLQLLYHPLETMIRPFWSHLHGPSETAGGIAFHSARISLLLTNSLAFLTSDALCLSEDLDQSELLRRHVSFSAACFWTTLGPHTSIGIRWQRPQRKTPGI
jgi:hypothetical protein